MQQWAPWSRSPRMPPAHVRTHSQIGTRFPELLHVAVGLMHRECCFAVPLAFVPTDPATGASLTPGQLRRLMGFKEHAPDASKPGVCVAADTCMCMHAWMPACLQATDGLQGACTGRQQAGCVRTHMHACNPY